MDDSKQNAPKASDSSGQHQARDHAEPDRGKYLRFAAMIATSAVAMYVVMYFNTYSVDHVFFSWTRAFMTMMSTGVMAVIMLGFMHRMYRSRGLNAAVVLVSVLLFGSGLWLVRSQATVGDVAWMEAMIPHHSIAILTSENAQITDPRVRELADSIIRAQVAEIEEMKTLIDELER